MPARHAQVLKTIEKTRLRPLAAFKHKKFSGCACRLATSIAKGVCLGLIAVSFASHQVANAEESSQLSYPDSSVSAHQVGGTHLAVKTQPVAAPHPKRADFERENKSEHAQHAADWVIDSGDNRGMPFAIVDKVDAKVFVFDAHGRLRGAAPVLRGPGPG